MRNRYRMAWFGIWVLLGVLPAGGAVEGEDPYQTEERAAVREILIRYKGAVGAGPEITRSQEEAKRLAWEIVRQIREEGEPFGVMVARHSEGYTKELGGYVAPFARGSRTRAYEDVVFPMKLGEISDPILTPHGYHIVLREKGDLYGGQAILIRYAGAGLSSEGVTRTREEAIALITEVYEQVVAHPDSFSHLARAYSEGPRPEMGGNLGTYHQYTYGEQIADTTAALEPGEMSVVFETPEGFVFLRRLK